MQAGGRPDGKPHGWTPGVPHRRGMARDQPYRRRWFNGQQRAFELQRNSQFGQLTTPFQLDFDDVRRQGRAFAIDLALR